MYEQYCDQNHGRQGVTDTTEKDTGLGFTIHRFVKELEEVQSTVQPLLVSEGAVVSSPEVAGAVAALKVPCRTQLRPCAGLMLPRVAAPSNQTSLVPDVQPLVLVYKEFLVYGTTREDVKQFLQLHKECDERLQKMNSGQDETDVDGSGV